MFKEMKIALYVSVMFLGGFSSGDVLAQSYTGDISSLSTKQDTQPEYSVPVPRIFSSDVSNVKLVEKLDSVYDNLLMSLWNYGNSDFVHQDKLSSLMEERYFKTTRYAKEFTPSMNNALENLNANYKSMMEEIDAAQAQYENIMKGLKTGDQVKLEPLWTEKITQLRNDAQAYFKMQHEFLNTYRNLVAFVLKQGGSYYYKSETQRVYFYKFGSYHYFGKTIDKLRMISYKQRQFLKARAPSNVDLLALQ